MYHHLVNQDSMSLIGCPDHDNYHSNCAMCMRIKQFREILAKDLLKNGHSINKVRDFMRMDRNKIAEISRHC